MHFELYRNGTRIGKVRPEMLNGNAIMSNINRKAEQEFAIATQEAIGMMDSLVNTMVRRRVLVDEDATYLADAYMQAMSNSHVSVENGQITMSLLDVKLMDKLLPMGGKGSQNKGGWWRIYESGSPGSRVGGSTRYGFVPIQGTDIVSKDGKKRANSKHGQGIMVDLSKVKNPGAIKPHPGVMPIRITYRFKNLLKDLFRSRKERVMEGIARSITGG